jgi:diguanylate cyclase (GGDEF)-like protein
MTKRSLITVSHAIERAAVASVATRDEPVVLVAMFQRPLFFDRERASYRELARTTTLTVVGVVDDRPDVPPGTEGIALTPDEPLAAEWSVVMLTPRAGAVLVATDREDVVPGEATIEKGRVFDGWFSFQRGHAQSELARLMRACGPRLSRHAHVVLGEVLDEANSRLSNPAEDRTDAAVRLLVDRLEGANRRVRSLEANLDRAGMTGGVDVLTGLRDRAWLQRYLGPSAGSAAGTLSLALVRLDIDGLDRLNRWAGRSVGDDLLRHVAMLIQRPLREVDQAVRLQDDDFLLVLPNVSPDQADRLARRLCGEIAALRTYATPEGGVSATAAVAVTRDRPLPLDSLEEALRGAKAARSDDGAGPRAAGAGPGADGAGPGAEGGARRESAARVRPYVGDVPPASG